MSNELPGVARRSTPEFQRMRAWCSTKTSDR